MSCRDVKCAACTVGNVSLWCAPFFCRAGTDFFIPALRLCRLAGRIYRRSARLYGLAGRMEKMWGMGEVGGGCIGALFAWSVFALKIVRCYKIIVI